MNEIQRLIHEMCPDGVPMVALGEICEIRGRIGFRGYTRADQVAEGEGALSLSPGNITNGVMDYSKGSFITWKKYEESPEIITNNGDIIFCKTASCGKVAIVKNLPYKATINPQLVVLKNVACPVPYLYYYLSSNSIQECVKKLQGVGSVPNISQATLSSFQIPFPPLTIQQRIVDILDKFTSLVSSLDSEIALRQKQYEYYRDKLLSFEEGEEGVEWKKLRDVCNVINGRAYKQSELLEKGPYRVLRVGNFFSNDSWYYSDLELDSKYYCFNGDLLYAWSASFGPHIWREEKVIYHYHIWKLECQEPLEKKFMFYWLQSDNMTSQVSSEKHGATMAHLTKAMMEDLILPIPSLDKQLSIVRTLDTFESLLTNLKKERELRQKQYEYYREKLLTFA